MYITFRGRWLPFSLQWKTIVIIFLWQCEEQLVAYPFPYFYIKIFTVFNLANRNGLNERERERNSIWFSSFAGVKGQTAFSVKCFNVCEHQYLANKQTYFCPVSLLKNGKWSGNDEGKASSNRHFFCSIFGWFSFAAWKIGMTVCFGIKYTLH